MATFASFETKLHAPPAPRAALQIHTYPASQWHELRLQWAQAAWSSPATCFFTQPDTVEAWLNVYGEATNPTLCLLEANGTTVGACLLVERRHRLGPFSLTSLHLNTAGDDALGGACIEYNGLIAKPGYEAAVGRALRHYIQSLSWDYLHLDGLAPNPAAVALTAGLHQPEIRQLPAYVADLATLRDDKQDYLSSLSSNTRSAIKRSIKAYEAAYGPVRLEAASTVPEGMLMLDQLIGLHQASWNARGLPGSFASPHFTEYTRQLVETLLPLGKVYVLRVMAGARLVGVLLNFLHAGSMQNYQSGLAPEESNKLKPGLTAHALAAQFALDQGFDEYDFLAGDFRYKEQLSSMRRPLQWVTIPRGTFKTRAIAALRNWKRRLRPVPVLTPQEASE